MNFKVEDKVIDFGAISKLSGEKTFKHIENVKTHVVSVTIKDKCPTCIVNIIRIVGMNMYPTRRMYPSQGEQIHGDEHMMIEPVFIKIRDIKLAHDCPIQVFDYSITHNKSFDNPILVNMSDSPVAKYMNDPKICVLGKGRTFNFKCEVIESTVVESGSSHHGFISLFDRTEIEQINEDIGGDEMHFNTGMFRFRYTDNIPGKEVFGNILKIAKNIYDTLLKDFDKYYMLNINVPYLEVPMDRSGALTHCIAYYVFLEKKSLYVVTNNDVGCILKYPTCTKDEIEPHIKSALKNIIKFLS